MKHYMDYGAFNDDPAPLIEVDTTRRTQVYSLTHTGEGQSLPFLDKAYISFTYGGKKIEDFGLIATTTGGGLNRQAPPAHEDFTTDNRVLHGQYYWGSHYQARQLGLELATDGITQRQLDEFKYWFAAGQIRELILAEHPNRAIMARIADAPEISLIPFKTQEEVMINGVAHTVETAEYKGSIHLNFVMDDPFWYAKKNYLGKIVNNESSQAVLTDLWLDANGNEVENFSDSPDFQKIVVEDRIPSGSMINGEVHVGDGALLSPLRKNQWAIVGENGTTKEKAQTQGYGIIDESILGAYYTRYQQPKEEEIITKLDDNKESSVYFIYDENTLSWKLNKSIFVKKGSTFTFKGNSIIKTYYIRAKCIITFNGTIETWNWRQQIASGRFSTDNIGKTWKASQDGLLYIEIASDENESFGRKQALKSLFIEADYNNKKTKYPSFSDIAITSISVPLDLPSLSNKKSLSYFYSGSAPSYPQLSFSTPIHFNEKGYIDVFNNEYLQQESNYNTLSLESEFKHELRFTTPSIFSSYNYAIKLLRADKGGLCNLDFSTAFQLLREAIPHFGVRSWVINCINLYKNNFNYGKAETEKKTTVDQQICSAVLEYMPYFFATGNDVDIKQDIAEKVSQFDNKDKSISIELQGVIKFNDNEIPEDVRGNICYCLEDDYVQIRTVNVTNVMLIAWRETVNGVTRNINLDNDELWVAIDENDLKKGIRTKRPLSSQTDLDNFSTLHTYDCLISNLFTAGQSKNSIGVKMRTNKIVLQNPSFTITRASITNSNKEPVTETGNNADDYYVFPGDTVSYTIKIEHKPRKLKYEWQTYTSEGWVTIHSGDNKGFYTITSKDNENGDSINLILNVGAMQPWSNESYQKYQVIVKGNNEQQASYEFKAMHPLFLSANTRRGSEIKISVKPRNDTASYSQPTSYEYGRYNNFWPNIPIETFTVPSYSQVKMQIGVPCFTYGLWTDDTKYSIDVSFTIINNKKDEKTEAEFLGDTDNASGQPRKISEPTLIYGQTQDQTWDAAYKTYEFYFDNAKDGNYDTTDYQYSLLEYSTINFTIMLKYNNISIDTLYLTAEWQGTTENASPQTPQYNLQFTDREGYLSPNKQVLCKQDENGNIQYYYCNQQNIKNLVISLTSLTNGWGYNWQYKKEDGEWTSRGSANSASWVDYGDQSIFQPGQYFELRAWFSDYINFHPEDESSYGNATIKIYYIPTFTISLGNNSNSLTENFQKLASQYSSNPYGQIIPITFNSINSSFEGYETIVNYSTNPDVSWTMINSDWFSSSQDNVLELIKNNGITFAGLHSIESEFFNPEREQQIIKQLWIRIQDVYGKQTTSQPFTIKVMPDIIDTDELNLTPTQEQSFSQSLQIQKTPYLNTVFDNVQSDKIINGTYCGTRNANKNGNTVQNFISNEIGSRLAVTFVAETKSLPKDCYYILEKQDDEILLYYFTDPAIKQSNISYPLSNISYPLAVEISMSEDEKSEKKLITVKGTPLFNLPDALTLQDKTINISIPKYDLITITKNNNGAWTAPEKTTQSTSLVKAIPGQVKVLANSNLIETTWTISSELIPYTKYGFELTQTPGPRASNYKFQYKKNSEPTWSTWDTNLKKLNFSTNSTYPFVGDDKNKINYQLRFTLQQALESTDLSLSRFEQLCDSLTEITLVFSYTSYYDYSHNQNKDALSSQSGAQLMYAARGAALLNNQNNINLSQKPKFFFDMKLGQYLMNIHYNTIVKPNGELESLTGTPSHIIYLSSLMDNDKKDSIYEEPVGNMILYNDFIFEEQNHFDLQTGKLQTWREDDPLLCHKLTYDGDIPLENLILMYKNLYL